jgi:hypothetical protein
MHLLTTSSNLHVDLLQFCAHNVELAYRLVEAIRWHLVFDGM